MKKAFKYLGVCILLVLMFLVGEAGVHKLYTENSPQTFDTENFIFHYQDVSRLKVNRVAKTLENQYGQILAILGADSHPKVNVYIHPSQARLEEALGFFAGGGIKGVDSLHIAQLPIPLKWIYPLKETAIHEFVHNVTLNMLVQQAIADGRINEVEEFDRLYSNEGKRFDEIYPRWIWESIAVYGADQYSALTFNMSVKDGFPTLQQLNGAHNQVYHVGYSIVDYIRSEWGDETLKQLILTEGDIQKVLGIPVGEFEKGWEMFVRDNYFVPL